jgi:lauroyl/myristoyl acyltransferase
MEPKMTSRSTRKGWLMFPLALILHLPLAIIANIFEFLGNLFKALANRIDRIMSKLPKPEINPQWRAEQQAKFLKEFNDRFRNNNGA